MKGTTLCLLSVLVMACATTPPPPPPPSQLVVKNASDKAYRLFVDRDYLLEVGPARSILVRNLPNAKYTITAQAGDDRLAADIEPGDGSQLMEFPIPGSAAVVVRTASLRLENRTRQDLQVTINGEIVGRSFAGSTTLFENQAAGEITLTLTNLITRGSWDRKLDLPALQETRHVVSAPVGTLIFSNDSQEALTLSVLRREFRIPPGARQLLDNLPPGIQKLHIRFLQTGRTMVLEETLQPDEEKAISLSDASGNITIENRLEAAADVYLNKSKIATVEAGQSYTVRGIAPGRVELVADGGLQHFEQPFLVTPESDQTWLLEAGNTQLLIRNRIGETVTLFVDNRSVMQLPDKQAVRFPVKPGPHELAAHCEATGHTTRRMLDVPGGRLIEVTFGPLAGRLYVENKTEKTLRFFRNGRPLDMLLPGEWAEHGGLPLGTSLLEVLDEKGTTLVSKQVAIKSRNEPRTDLVVEGVETELTVRNETGEAVRIGPPARADLMTLPIGGETRVFFPGSKGVLKLKGEHTGNRYDRLFDGAGHDGVINIVLAPVTGGIVVENSTPDALEILLDGELWDRIEPGKSLRRDRVAPGKHRLQAKAGKVLFEEVSCRLVEDSWYVWRLQPKTATLRVLNRTQEALKLLRSGSPAGILQPGTEVRFEGLEPGPVELAAFGKESGQYYRFTVRARADKTAQWKILPAAGGVRLHGFEGEAATISVNGTEVLSVPAGIEEPVAMPLQSGVQALRVRFTDGTDVVGIVRVTANLYSTLHIKSGSPRVTLRNQTQLPLNVMLDGLKVSTVAAGAEQLVIVEQPGKHTLSARHEQGTGEWALKDIYLDRGRSFGWTVSE